VISQYVCAITGCNWVHNVPDPVTADLQAPDSSDGLQVAAAAFDVHIKAIEDAVRAHFETHSTEEWLREVMGLRAQMQQRPPLLCGACISDARNAEARKQPAPPILPASTIASGMAVCDVEGRHRIMPQVGGGLVMPGGSIPGMN
jgi:hypothetical protein